MNMDDEIQFAYLELDGLIEQFMPKEGYSIVTRYKKDVVNNYMRKQTLI
jgi:hypothetical protein